MRSLLELAGAFQRHSCTCNETAPKSGQAWRGFERAHRVLAGFPRGEKKPPEGGDGVMGGAGQAAGVSMAMA